MELCAVRVHNSELRNDFKEQCLCVSTELQFYGTWQGFCLRLEARHSCLQCDVWYFGAIYFPVSKDVFFYWSQLLSGRNLILNQKLCYIATQVHVLKIKNFNLFGTQLHYVCFIYMNFLWISHDWQISFLLCWEYREHITWNEIYIIIIIQSCTYIYHVCLPLMV